MTGEEVQELRLATPMRVCSQPDPLKPNYYAYLIDKGYGLLESLTAADYSDSYSAAKRRSSSAP
jgi:hypothetical protein